MKEEFAEERHKQNIGMDEYEERSLDMDGWETEYRWT
jgi:hypothetical protein